jgi:hypothetical protein
MGFWLDPQVGGAPNYQLITRRSLDGPDYAGSIEYMYLEAQTLHGHRF